LSQWRGPQFREPVGHGPDGGYEFLGHGRGHIEHFQAARVDPGVLEELFSIFNDLSGSKVPFHKVAFAFHTACDENRISAVTEGFQQKDRLHLAGTEQFHDPDIVRILYPHGTGEVRSIISTVRARERYDFHILKIHEIPSARRPGGFFLQENRPPDPPQRTPKCASLARVRLSEPVAKPGLRRNHLGVFGKGVRGKTLSQKGFPPAVRFPKVISFPTNEANAIIHYLNTHW